MDKKIGNFFNKIKDIGEEVISKNKSPKEEAVENVQNIENNEKTENIEEVENNNSTIEKIEKKDHELKTFKIVSPRNMFFNSENNEKKEKMQDAEEDKYSMFASGFPEWTLEPPGILVKRRGK